jgi:hemerythrin-like metal-binding protein
VSIFEWNDELSVGDKTIDDDHRHLLALMNSLDDAIGESRGTDVLARILDDLIIYTDEHFKREEKAMQGIRFSGFSEHKHAHDRLTGEVVGLQRKFTSGETKLTVEIMMFLFSWLFEHIMEADKQLGVAIRQAGAAKASPEFEA